MTLTLPVVLLALAWWQRGRIQRRDLLRVVPFLLIGFLMVGIEVYEQHLSAQQTVVRSDGLLSRTAVAGCAVWFYLWKLVWPVNLMLVYPRWNLAPSSARWFLPGLLLAAVLALAWRWRHCWGRPVLMLIVCYVALLLPVLGFVNIDFMEYSLVADHWQYAAMIVPCAVFAGLVSCQWSLVSGRWSVVGRGQRTTDNGQRTTDVHPSSFILHSFSVAGGALHGAVGNLGVFDLATEFDVCRRRKALCDGDPAESRLLVGLQQPRRRFDEARTARRGLGELSKGR